MNQDININMEKYLILNEIDYLSEYLYKILGDINIVNNNYYHHFLNRKLQDIYNNRCFREYFELNSNDFYIKKYDLNNKVYYWLAQDQIQKAKKLIDLLKSILAMHKYYSVDLKVQELNISNDI